MKVVFFTRIIETRGGQINLQYIKKSYSAVISLGSECGPGIHLRRHSLRDDQGVTTGSHPHFIKDLKYNVISVHDFPIVPEQH